MKTVTIDLPRVIANPEQAQAVIASAKFNARNTAVILNGAGGHSTISQTFLNEFVKLLKEKQVEKVQCNQVAALVVHKLINAGFDVGEASTC